MEYSWIHTEIFFARPSPGGENLGDLGEGGDDHTLSGILFLDIFLCCRRVLYNRRS